MPQTARKASVCQKEHHLAYMVSSQGSLRRSRIEGCVFNKFLPAVPASVLKSWKTAVAFQNPRTVTNMSKLQLPSLKPHLLGKGMSRAMQSSVLVYMPLFAGCKSLPSLFSVNVGKPVSCLAVVSTPKQQQ